MNLNSSSTLSPLQPNPKAVESYKWVDIDEWGPEKVLQVYDPDTGMKGVLVIDNTVTGPGKGGNKVCRQCYSFRGIPTCKNDDMEMCISWTSIWRCKGWNHSKSKRSQ